MSKSPLAVVRSCLQAYVDKNRAAIESLIAPEYRFTSPIDNRLERATYFDRCWPNSKMMESFEYTYEVEEGERAFVVYEAKTKSGRRFRNCEVHTVRNDKLVETQVYFGWDLPHKAPEGGFIDNDGTGHA